MAGWQVGIDIGGTFTDVVAFNAAKQEVLSAKVKSVAGNPIEGLLAGLHAVGLKESDVDELVHGTTIVTNAIVELHFAKTALVATQGFADVLAIGRQNRRHLYRLDLTPKLPPLVPGEFCFEVAERMDFKGNVVRSLERASVERLLHDLRKHEIESVAVSLIHSYANPQHEIELLTAIRAVVPHVAVSHRVNPESREFERANTTVLSAGVTPLVAGYIDALEKQWPAESELHFFHSASGLCSRAVAREQPLSLALSGPAAGVSAACRVAETLGLERALTFDMGGTTTDVCLLKAGSAEITSNRSLAGHPLRMPAVAVESIGAGGGSLVRLDGGTIRVGPESAGAYPGPACYGQGGTLATVADASIVLGFLEDGATFGGSIRLSRAKAEAAIAPIAAELGLEIVATALGIIKVANSLMANALRRATVERGIDARTCALIAFGGAGPIHAVDVARLVGIKRIIIPEHSSAFSALGCLMADIRHTQHQTIRLVKDGWDKEQLENVQNSMIESARRKIGRTELEPEFRWVAAVRYIGQSYAVEIDSPALEDCTDLDGQFKAEHAKLYGFASDESWEVIALRLTAVVPRKAGSGIPPGTHESTGPKAFRDCYFDATSPIQVPDYARSTLPRNRALPGPAIISDKMSTLIVPDGAFVTVTDAGHLDIALRSLS